MERTYSDASDSKERGEKRENIKLNLQIEPSKSEESRRSQKSEKKSPRPRESKKGTTSSSHQSKQISPPVSPTGRGPSGRVASTPKAITPSNNISPPLSPTSRGSPTSPSNFSFFPPRRILEMSPPPTSPEMRAREALQIALSEQEALNRKSLDLKKAKSSDRFLPRKMSQTARHRPATTTVPPQDNLNAAQASPGVSNEKKLAKSTSWREGRAYVVRKENMAGNGKEEEETSPRRNMKKPVIISNRRIKDQNNEVDSDSDSDDRGPIVNGNGNVDHEKEKEDANSTPRARRPTSAGAHRFPASEKARENEDETNKIGTSTSKASLAASNSSSSLLLYSSRTVQGSTYMDLPLYHILHNTENVNTHVKLLAKPPFYDKDFEPKEPSPRLYGRSISTYGTDPISNEPLGEPIADSFLGCECFGLTFLAVADGCGWGNAPSKAAQNSIRGFYHKLMARLKEGDRPIKDSRALAHYMLIALSYANLEVLNGGVAVDGLQTSAGTTTLLAGVIVKIDQESADEPRFLFLGVSLGDCKIYRFSEHRLHPEALEDPTRGGPRGSDRYEPGGRLGPADYQRPDVPDLRNLQMISMPLDVGDILILVTDGVHDNLDPTVLGKWEETTTDIVTGKQVDWGLLEIDEYKRKKAQDILDECLKTHGDAASSEKISEAFLSHVNKLTGPIIEHMRTNPSRGRMKADYKTHPGKQDHATILVYKVGQLE